MMKTANSNKEKIKMECVVFDRKDYGGYWRRSFADFIDITLLSIVFTFGEAGWSLKMLIYLAYMIGFKIARGATPGYMILGMKIVSINHQKVTVVQIVVRLISSFFSAFVIGLGFIAIVYDKNRQSWHDKIAGTYVIRTEAYPLYKTEIIRSSLIDIRVFAFMALGTCLFFVCLFGGIRYIGKSSEAYKMSQNYIVENPMIQEIVGSTIKFDRSPVWNFPISGESGEASYEIHVSGDKGEATVVTILKKEGGQWKIIKAGYLDKDRNFIDLNKPYQ